jgi:putative drug exporter of the RND superfamily
VTTLSQDVRAGSSASNGAARGPTRATNRLGRLARWSFRRRRTVVVLWLVLLVAVTGASRMAGTQFRDKFGDNGSESQRALNVLKAHFPSRAGDSAQVVFATDGLVTSAANRAAITATVSRLTGLPHVAALRSPFDPGAANQISSDGHIAYATIDFDRTTDALSKPTIQTVADNARQLRHGGFDVILGGAPIAKIQKFSYGGAEGIGILAAVVILLLTFGSVIAMGLPILTALFGIAIAFGVLDLLSHGFVTPSFAPELAAMIGIGVGIDYALFVVTRYRQALHDGLTPEDSVTLSLATSGRAVLFAGCTVVISLVGMFLLGESFIYGLGFGAIGAVLLVMGGALTLLPAILGFVGHNIDRLHVPHLLRRGSAGGGHTFWWRWSRVIQRRPWVAGGIAFAMLVVLALPLFAMHLAFTDAGNDPAGQMTRRSYDLLSQGFGPGSSGPLVVAAELRGGSADAATLNRLQAGIRQDAGVAVVVPAQLNRVGDAAVVTVIPKTSPQDKRTEQLVRRLRNQIIPSVARGSDVHALVGGYTAAAVDSAHRLQQRLFLVIGAVVVLSFLLLMAVFRSIAVPLKAAVMNLLSVGAAYGVIVAVFQWGWLGSVINIGKTGPIDPWIPLMLFTILFGLSMDYEVFLLSRVREEWRRTGDNATAVADGIASTGRIITAAAAIMVCVFASFVLGDQRVLKVFGLGLATAIFVDATLVRMVLVPSTMELLGNSNWWLPRWLDRIVPVISVEVDA